MPPSLAAEKQRSSWWLIAIVAATFALYFNGAGGPFLLDDFGNIVLNQQLQIVDLSFSSLWNAALSSEAGLLRRPVAMLSFAFNYYFDGLDPYYFKIVNIVIHLATAVLLFFLTKCLLERLNAAHPAHAIGSLSGAALITAMWALHPLHVSTVLYSVQRMTELATLFTVAGILLYVQGREQMLAGHGGLARIVFGLAGCGTLAILSKENGALLPVYLLVVEGIFFRFKTGTKPVVANILFTILILSSIAILAYLIHVLLAPPPLARAFTQSERLMTESRIVLDYLGQILLPRVNDMSLFDSGTEISLGLWSPPTTLPAIIALGFMLAGCLYAVCKNIWHPLAFAIGWFLAGHLLESTSIPLELRFEHRNYLASYGILFGVGHAMMSAKMARRLRPTLHVALIATLLVGLAGQLHERVGQWSKASDLYRFELTQHPGSPRAWSSLAFSESWQGHFENAAELYSKAAEVEPREIGHLIALFNIRLNELNSPGISDMSQQIINRLENAPLSAYAESQLTRFAWLTFNKSRNDPSRTSIIKKILSTAAKHSLWTSNDSRATCLYYFAEIALYEKQWGPAIEALRSSIDIYPNANRQFILALLLQRTGKFAEAQKELGRIDKEKLEDSLRAQYDSSASPSKK